MGTNTYFFTLNEVDELRDRAQDAAWLGSQREAGWCELTDQPRKLLACFPRLWLAPGYELRAHVWFSGRDGRGRMYAVPAGSPPSEFAQDLLTDPPPPREALEHFMDAIEGDGSPSAYLQGSLLCREAGELGAFWHGVSWGAHTLLGADPLVELRDQAAIGGGNQTGAAGPPSAEERRDRPSGSPDDWVRRDDLEDWPQHTDDWRPQVEMREREVMVTFYSFSAMHQQCIYRHRDLYRAGSYRLQSVDEPIAFGPLGFIP